MEAVHASLVAVGGTLLGIALGHFLQSRLTRSQLREARRDRNREHYRTAAADLAEAVSVLIQAETDRAKARFAAAPEEARERARREVYDQRTRTRSAAFRLQLVGDPVEDRTMVATAEDLISLCRSISTDSTTLVDAEGRKQAANLALEALIRDAHQRAYAI